jgi:hypothetical protein
VGLPVRVSHEIAVMTGKDCVVAPLVLTFHCYPSLLARSRLNRTEPQLGTHFLLALS